MHTYRKLIQLLLAGVLLIGALAPTAQAKSDEPRAHPALLQLAAEHPADTFMVIVQREVKNKALPEDEPEAAVEKAGGQVHKQLPMIESFSAELTGKEIEKLARHPKVRWITFDAPLISTAAGDPTVRDEFSTAAYSNNNGTQSWAGNWAETGDGSVSATAGYVKISGGQLQLSGTNRMLSRQANLAGAASATLSFQYKRSGLDDVNDYIAIQASANGGSSWTELARYKGAGSDSAWQTASFNMVSYAAANTQIRFATSSTLGNSDILYVDNVQIEYALPASTPTPSPTPAPTATAAPPAGFVVNSTGDAPDANTGDGVCQTSTAGQCTLRAALQQANARAGMDTITFNIAGAGPYTIQPTSALPTVTDPVVINGASEPDFAGSPIIELDGSLAGAGVNGLTIQAGNSTVRGLVINRFSQDGIRLDVNDNNLVAGNYIGTDVSGALDRGNLGSGILLYYQSGGNTIGGPMPADRNVISGNDYHGIFSQWSAANVIQGNMIGLNAAGVAPLPNGVASQNTSGTGIYIQQADGNLIGGVGRGAGNVISGNLRDGVFASNSNNTTIQGNLIGTDLTGAQDQGNGNEGVFVSGGAGARIGGAAAGERNVISGNGSDGIDFQAVNGLIQGNYVGTDRTGALSLPNNHTGLKINGYAANNLVSGNVVAFNGYGGVVVAGDTVTGNAILGNSVHSNNGLGVNLGYDQSTVNDGVVGAGANGGMDYPVITSASLSSCWLTLAGYVGSAANQSAFANARVEIFESVDDSNGYGEGQRLLGYLTADASGNFSGNLPGLGLAAGDRLVGAATDGSNNTSEFGLNYQLTTVTGNCAPNPFTGAVRASELWAQAPGLQGQGIGVAVVDSGIATHGDLQARIVANDNQTTAPNASDGYAHGTHVAGIIGGSGLASNGARLGVAPRVNLINVKVSNDVGNATTSDLIDGLQWILANKATYNIRVVNISLNSTVAESYHTNPLDAAVEILWFNGIVVVVAAGNNGTDSGPVTLYPPANDPFVITVGATDDYGTAALTDDTLAVFSAYGTTESGLAKPDLVAPGRNIISLLAGTSAYGYVNHPAHRVDNNYFRMSGTSMAAPVVSGAVALLLQDEPDLTPDQVKYRLKATANTAWPGYEAAKAGAGYLDIYAAVNGATTESANTNLIVSQLLTTGSDAVNSTVNWNSVNWNSVNWNSVNWNSVNWNSVNWNSVNWNSAVWDD